VHRAGAESTLLSKQIFVQWTQCLLNVQKFVDQTNVCQKNTIVLGKAADDHRPCPFSEVPGLKQELRAPSGTLRAWSSPGQQFLEEGLGDAISATPGCSLLPSPTVSRTAG
jgi:hypothetical protein